MKTVLSMSGKDRQMETEGGSSMVSLLTVLETLRLVKHTCVWSVGVMPEMA